ncbi:MED7 protein-domain-containing protein [Protomyces lactucae-debilis]|uniref:Mediator of RNA polymerase II transcription subunit 7 n=1 Tax=Protomyces lactucae-debilis TaxID=2754530 RepID=A0A1Y2F1P6_PROLT|nr:MED7 protein-domain-containing protein [Protomyces lactucae-debilis]ORY77789.1 MED7 protein-domain-containing protein [Protomyces lactucae-debilis]
MADSAGISSAFPPPPESYKLFTEENLAQLAQDPAQLPDEVRQALEPPEVPTESYTVFGQTWHLQEKLQTLKEAGVKQLYPESLDAGTGNPVPELQKLARSIFMTFLELVKGMSHDPESFPGGLEHMRVLLLNMHHLINGYRPHQARETLALMMEQQIQRRQEEIAHVEALNVKAKRLLSIYEQGDTLMADEQQPPQRPKNDPVLEKSIKLWACISELK